MLGDRLPVEPAAGGPAREVAPVRLDKLAQTTRTGPARQALELVADVLSQDARPRQVEPGHRGPVQTEILQGLQPGEAVVIHPDAAIRDGARVVFRSSRTART